MSTQPLNLDQKAAQYAQSIVPAGIKSKDAKALENLVTKTLGVLQEQGVYAMMLFLLSRSSDEKSISENLRPHLYHLLGELPPFRENELLKKLDKQSSVAEVLKFYSDHVCDDLDTLLFVRELYEQTLIYARFGAKAAAKEKDEKPAEDR